MLETCLRPRPNHVRMMVLSLIAIQITADFCSVAEGTVAYIFTKDKFEWTEDKAGLRIMIWSQEPRMYILK
jgi:hypothetical protein